MKVELTLTSDDGTIYKGTAELKEESAQQLGSTQPRRSNQQLEATRLPGRILALREADYFREPRSPQEVHAKLSENYHCVLNRVQMALLRMGRKRELRKANKRIGDKTYDAYVW